MLKSQKYFLFPNAEILLILEDELFVELWAVYKQLYDWPLISFCPVLAWCLLHNYSNISECATGLSAGQKKVRK